MTWRWYSVIVLLPMTLMSVIATVRPLQWLSMVPDPIATHFDAAGNPDGFASPGSAIALLSGIMVAVVIAMAVALRFRYLTGTNGRILSGSANATVVLLALIQLDLFKSQTTLTDATNALLPPSTLGIAFGVAAIVGVGVGLVPPPPPKDKSETPGEPPLVGAEPEESEWRRIETLHPGVQVFVVLSIVAVVGVALMSPNWISIGAAALVVILVVATWGWRLRVDAQGFHYSGFLGFPRATIPYASIASVEFKDIRPADWGGWGWRIAGAGTGLITRSGPGVRITRTNGRVLEASAKDAERAVSLLNYYVQSDVGQQESEPPAS